MIDIHYQSKKNTATALLVCNEDQAKEVLSNVNTYNSGTWLEPYSMDVFVNIWAGGKHNPSIQKLSSKTKKIEWFLEGENEGELEAITTINYIELKMIDKYQQSIIREDEWNEIFKLDKQHVVSPNGSIFIKDDDGFNIKLKKNINRDYIIGYTLYFSFEESDKVYYCKIDPIIQIRGDD